MPLVRLAETTRQVCRFTLDGRAMEALDGDTVLTAILAAGEWVRRSEYGDGVRAGFCWMGACQDCVVLIEGQGRVRACTTALRQDMAVQRP